MASNVIMPKAGMAMEDGLIVRWLKSEGDRVRQGEAIAEIETDKSAMELEAEADGVLLEILKAAGERVPVTETIAWIGEAGEVPAATGSAAAPAKLPSVAAAARAAAPEAASPAAAANTLDSSSRPATPAARRRAAEAGVDLAAVAAAVPGAALRAADVESHIRAEASPLASRLAAEAGLDIGALRREKGSRVMKEDVQRAAANATAPAGGAAALTGAPPTAARADLAAAGDRRVPLTKIQRISGERLSRCHAEIPPVTICATADVTELLEIRERLNARLAAKLKLNDFAVRAAAKALAENPRANAVLDGDAILLKGSIDIGLAVATESGLLVPVLRGAATLSLEEAAGRARDLADRARARRLKPEELEGGTFTVTNVGMFGVTSFTPLINQPEVGILGIGAIEARLARGKDGSIQDRSLLHLSFTFDHRALDGAESSKFLKSVRDLLEAPLLLVI